MVNLTTMRAALPAFKNDSQGFVAVFVGGTSGIGEAAVKAFAKWSIEAKAYVVGRNAASAAQTLAACRALSPSSTFEFIQQDIVLLKDVDTVCSRIAEAESKVDLLYMTPDIPTFSGRCPPETEEHIDRLMSLRYYGRMRFIYNFLPLLERALTPRVVSVFGPKRFEYGLDLDDLGLKEHYGNIAAYSHCSLMNTLCMEQYAARHPAVSFVHVYPGLVLTTNVISGNLPWIVRKLIQWAIYPMLYLFAQSYDEAGDRMMFISLSASLPPRSMDADGRATMLPCSGETAILVGSEDTVGSGNYCVDWKANRMNNSANLNKLRFKGARERVWEHTLGMFGSIND
ncbi:hypothetical protein EDB81DRAFT_856624 [Dactylonectria macrodidyma]|uniref:Uncharacterized protein n=1 Tax=Dactylonectria macrodidyma TaxID=307937 RepID=A0A9P9EVL1_9HYPO|nr:hypothetical protein EDB81DRAFT_856624 [Dactylonectria macrodidyma]